MFFSNNRDSSSKVPKNKFTNDEESSSKIPSYKDPNYKFPKSKVPNIRKVQSDKVPPRAVDSDNTVLQVGFLDCYSGMVVDSIYTV